MQDGCVVANCNKLWIHTIPFVCDLCPEAKKRRKNMGGLHEDKTALSSLFAALQTRPQLFKERIVISYPADIIAIQRTTYFDLHHFGCSKLEYIVSSRPALSNG